MPTYDYQCPQCGYTESFYYTTADKKVAHPVCQTCRVAMNRMISPPTIIVKNPHPAREGRGKGR